ncbi:MAG: succinylglutamate desuccinylase/aspartoacylase family protein [Pseudomonadota bacterium]
MARKPALTIGETQVPAGTRASINLPVADLYTGTSLSMPVHVVNGKSAGPTMVVCAAIHGDELNGIEIIKRLLKRKALTSMKGTLIAVPIVNVHGFLDLSRYLPDRRDLNRSFPGSAKGSIASRTAHTFVTEILSKADIGIDLHTGAVNRSNLPQIRAYLENTETRDLARAFGTPVVVNSNIRDGSLRDCAADRGLPMLVYEAGEALRFDEISIKAGVVGIIKVMRYIGMLPKARKTRDIDPLIADFTSWVRAPASGIITPRVELGARVKEGQRLATIADPLGDEAEFVSAPFAGIVIGRNNLPVAHEGDALFNLAAFKSVSRAEDKVEAFTQTHS